MSPLLSLFNSCVGKIIVCIYYYISREKRENSPPLSFSLSLTHSLSPLFLSVDSDAVVLSLETHHMTFRTNPVPSPPPQLLYGQHGLSTTRCLHWLSRTTEIKTCFPPSGLSPSGVVIASWGRYRFAVSRFAISHFANSGFADCLKIVTFRSHFANFPMLFAVGFFLVILSSSVSQSVSQIFTLSFSVTSRTPVGSPS